MRLSRRRGLGNVGRRWSVDSGKWLALVDSGLFGGEEEARKSDQPEQQRMWTVAEALAQLCEVLRLAAEAGRNIPARTGHSSSCQRKGGTPAGLGEVADQGLLHGCKQKTLYALGIFRVSPRPPLTRGCSPRPFA